MWRRLRVSANWMWTSPRERVRVTEAHLSILAARELLLITIPEHKGVSNRLLCALGWVQINEGCKRSNPWNSDIKLRSDELLWDRYKELVSLQNNAATFLKCVFHTSDNIWVDRCNKIINAS